MSATTFFPPFTPAQCESSVNLEQGKLDAMCLHAVLNMPHRSFAGALLAAVRVVGLGLAVGYRGVVRSTRARTHTRTHTHTHAHTHTHTRTHSLTHARTHTRIHTRIHTHAHIHTHARTHARTHAHMRPRTHARTQPHTYTHARTHAVTIHKHYIILCTSYPKPLSDMANNDIM